MTLRLRSIEPGRTATARLGRWLHACFVRWCIKSDEAYHHACARDGILTELELQLQRHRLQKQRCLLIYLENS